MPRVTTPNQYPYDCVGLLHITLDDGSSGWGTGTLIDDRHILTCGHNLFHKGSYAKAARFYPHYDSTQLPSGGKAIAYGYLPTQFAKLDVTWDIAVYRLEAPLYAPTKFMVPEVVTTTQEPTKTMDIAGYPSNKHYEMWTDQQVWNGIDVANHVFAYSHQTEAGSSGSPLFQLHGGTARIYGVHRGLAETTEDKVGVLITEVTAGFLLAATQRGPSDYFIVKI